MAYHLLYSEQWCDINKELAKTILEKFKRIQLELNCLQELHMLCIQAKLILNPITGLFLELYLQWNGAILSNRFLEKLAVLLEQHGFVTAVDEVLTGSRCAKFLQIFQKPSSFAKRANFICLGKWMGMGIVLARAEMLDNSIVSQTEEIMGTNYNEAVSTFK
eukprot:3971368-Ditylum_brightwellii.AAC.1